MRGDEFNKIDGRNGQNVVVKRQVWKPLAIRFECRLTCWAWTRLLARISPVDHEGFVFRGVAGDSVVFSASFSRVILTGCELSSWTPRGAEISGLRRRWYEEAETLLAWRAEHSREWIAKQLRPTRLR